MSTGTWRDRPAAASRVAGLGGVVAFRWIARKRAQGGARLGRPRVAALLAGPASEVRLSALMAGPERSLFTLIRGFVKLLGLAVGGAVCLLALFAVFAAE